MHFCCIISRFTQNINNLSDRILCFIRPLYNFHHSFVSILTSLQFIFRDKNIIGKRTVLRHKKSIRPTYLQSAYHCIISTFKNLYNFSFCISFFSFCIKGYFYLIIIHCMSRIALRNKNRFTSTFGNKRILSITFTLECSYQYCSVIIQFIFSFINLGKIIIFQHVRQNIHAEHL